MSIENRLKISNEALELNWIFWIQFIRTKSADELVKLQQILNNTM
jgi:hypothetical protein